MKWTLMIVAICMLSLHASSDSDLDTVKQLLTDLKTNVQLDIEALDAAWEKHKQNKLSVVEALGFSAQEQRSECAKKDDDVESKKRDIKITNDFVAWMQKRQFLNSQRLSILEQNRCQASNNYVHDIKNYKIALALVQFLRAELDKMGSNVSLAQKSEFLQKVDQFMRMYHTGKLLNMVENIQMNDDGTYVLPNIEGDEQDLTESVLTTTRGQKNKNANKILLQQSQTTVIANGDGDDKADSAVVLIPGQCDDSINTVVVVQNDDGTGDDDDLHIKFTTGGSGSGTHRPTPRPHPHVDPHPHHQPAAEETDDDEETDDEEGDDGEDGEDSGETAGEEGESDDGENGETGEETTGEGETGETDLGEGESGEGDQGEGDQGEETNGEEDGGDHSVDGGDTNGGKTGGASAAKQGEEEEDLSDIRKLLDAIEKHSKKSLDTEQEDEVRSSMIYIDFKLHTELENQTFDNHISGEKENLIKLNNQLTNRVSIARQCNARLKQITIAHQVSQEDYNDSYQHYLELRKQKEEELATFEDVYRIYTNQVA